MKPILRPYQQEIVDNIHQEWNNGHANIGAVLPTGGGKSVVISSIISEHEGACAVLAHRQELVSQMSMHLARDGIHHRIIASKLVIKICCQMQMQEFGRVYYNNQSSVAVGSVQTIIRRGDELKTWLPTVKLWVIDELHHLLNENLWGRAVDMFTHPHVKGLGVTATPLRADGKGLGRDTDGVLDKLIVGPNMRELINQGFLTDYRIFAPVNTIDFNQARISKVTGDYNKNDIGEIVGKSSLVVHEKSTRTGDVVAHYLKIAKNKLGITFVPDMETGREITQQFNDVGVPAVLVNAKTPDLERAGIIRRFANRELMQLVNVDIFGEGTDIPALEVVSMARPTASYGLFVQMFGRVLRILDGKTHGIVIDHVGNCAKHGLPDSPREWSLDRKKRGGSGDDENVIPVKACPECTFVYERYHKACPDCGYVPIPAERSSIEYVDGDLSELSPEILAQLRGEVTRADRPIEEQLEEYDSNMNEYTKPIHRMAHLKRMRAKLNHQRESQVKLREKMSWWGGYRRAEGLSDDELMKLFYLRYGVDWVSAMALPGDEADALCEGIVIGKKVDVPAYTLDKCWEEALKYETKRLFRRHKVVMYEFLRHNHPEVFNEIFPTTQVTWTKESAIEKAKECKNKSEFNGKYPGAYMFLLRNHLELFNEMLPAINATWTKESAIEKAKECKNKTEFNSKHPGAYQCLKHKHPKILNELLPNTKRGPKNDM